MSLAWNCDATVDPDSETALLETLSLESEDVLYRSLVGELDMPTQTGMTEYQVVNLLRQVLREKMGEERFNSIAIFGSFEGQKAAGDLFESIVETYLRKNNIRFHTENDLKLRKPKGPRMSPVQVSKWKSTSTVDSQGRKLFSGPCSLCGTICECPFKPTVGREGPQCRDCFICLTPDFVLLDNVYINGQKVVWIDCKCYYGSAHMGIYGQKSLQRVSHDYSNKWGPGAVIFAFSFCTAFNLDGVLLLDATPFDMTRLDEMLENAPFRQLRRRNQALLAAADVTAAEVGAVI